MIITFNVMEELFSIDEINEIIQEATKDDYKQPNLFFPTLSKLQIYKVSKKGLILVHGNEFTGKKHIELRHCITSRHPFKDNPTKFIVVPIEYLTVADSIYKESNLDIAKNSRPDLFECYTGKHNDTTYRLILYKNSKIIHTLYAIIKGKPFNKYVKHDLIQGFYAASIDLLTGKQIFTSYYYDSDNRKKFKILLECEEFEKWYIEILDDNEAPISQHLIKSSNVNEPINYAKRISILNFENQTWIDKILYRIIKSNYKFKEEFL